MNVVHFHDALTCGWRLKSFFCVCKKYAASRDKYSRLLSSVTANVLPPGFSSKSLSRSVRETGVQKFAAIQLPSVQQAVHQHTMAIGTWTRQYIAVNVNF